MPWLCTGLTSKEPPGVKRPVDPIWTTVVDAPPLPSVIWLLLTNPPVNRLTRFVTIGELSVIGGRLLLLMPTPPNRRGGRAEDAGAAVGHRPDRR